jgi:wyosine [tRNA(Phe)-imidazoG37] synthetase (radical SAM superfamily)
VPSWRLGRSLGIDPICRIGKVCSFDCLYCQLGRTNIRTRVRKTLVRPARMAKDLASADKSSCDIITFSGTGEPTLNKSIGEMIRIAKGYGKPVAVLTNSSLLSMDAVRVDLMGADIVCAKLDAPDEGTFRLVNRPVRGISFDFVLDGIKSFHRSFKGKLAIQSMFIAKNQGCASEMAAITKEIKPDEVQLDTPLRRSAVRALGREAMEKIEAEYSGLPVKQVYKSEMPRIQPFDIHQTKMRRP